MHPTYYPPNATICLMLNTKQKKKKKKTLKRLLMQFFKGKMYIFTDRMHSFALKAVALLF